MKKKIEMKTKLAMSVVGLFTLTCIISPIKANAALQANKNPGNSDTIDNWLLNVRKMESTGGTLGLSDDTINTDLTSTTKNNLDIHMEKNTEYGAMAILSASAYGNQNKINNGETTTGNKTGIYIYLNSEVVAAGTSKTPVANFKSAIGKYKNIYTTEESSAKIGDAITETKNWHTQNGDNFWILGDVSALLRARSGSLFSYFGNYLNDWAHINKSYRSRAVVVIGNGF